MFIHSARKGLFDIMPAGVDKSFGLKKIADYYGIPYEEVCVFGDYDNDSSLFRWLGLRWPWAMRFQN